jgi:DNA-binding transcriptional MocR family regulator
MKQINFLRGWPNPTLLPTSAIATAAQKALSNPEVSTPGLLYGPDPGYQPLREEIARWLSGFYAHTSPLKTGAESSQSIRQPDPERICITGGASQNLACILQVFTDPLFTTVWMVAPCYFLACRIFQDSCLETRAVLEGDEGIDLVGLERGMRECDERKTSKVSHYFMSTIMAMWMDRGYLNLHGVIEVKVITFYGNC